MAAYVDLWLDDMRPAPEGWLWVKTCDEAKKWLEQGVVRRASLDHDLGACDECNFKKGIAGTLEEVQFMWLEQHNYQTMPHCEHFGTGYQLVCWMEETGHWPLVMPVVHSRNPVGKANMMAAINRAHEKEGRWTS